MNWEAGKVRQKSIHLKSLPRTEGWIEISTVLSESLTAPKTSGVTSEETDVTSRHSWSELRLSASKNISLQRKLEKIAPDCCPSSASHLGVCDVCLAIVGQQERQWPGFPQAKQVPVLGRREGKPGTFNIRGWCWNCEREVDAGIPTDEDLLLEVEKVVFFFLRAWSATRARLSALWILFSSSESSARSCCLYSSTVAQPNSDLSANKISFCLSQSSFSPATAAFSFPLNPFNVTPELTQEAISQKPDEESLTPPPPLNPAFLTPPPTVETPSQQGPKRKRRRIQFLNYLDDHKSHGKQLKKRRHKKFKPYKYSMGEEDED